MLCFLFAALIVALDQFFKQWVVRTIEIGNVGPEVIPGILGLTRWENDGAMLNILSGQQWLLAAIALAAAVVLIMILLRYNEGFWGTLGLAAVLGGTVGNLADRIFNDGKVVDMFRTLFMDFPIFNIADVFITLGFITFLIHFIALTIKGEGNERATNNYNESDYDDGQYDDGQYDEFPQQQQYETQQPQYNTQEQQRQQQQPQYETQLPQYDAQEAGYAQDDYLSPSSDYINSGTFDSVTEETADSSFTLDSLESELGSLDDYSDYDVDDLLREYGLDDDDTL